MCFEKATSFSGMVGSLLTAAVHKNIPLIKSFFRFELQQGKHSGRQWFSFAIMILITDNVCTLTFSDWVVTSSVTSLVESAIVSCICNLLIRFGCEVTCNTCGRVSSCVIICNLLIRFGCEITCNTCGRVSNCVIICNLLIRFGCEITRNVCGKSAIVIICNLSIRFGCEITCNICGRVSNCVMCLQPMNFFYQVWLWNILQQQWHGM